MFSVHDVLSLVGILGAFARRRYPDLAATQSEPPSRSLGSRAVQSPLEFIRERISRRTIAAREQIVPPVAVHISRKLLA
jgi:hypothetical protein